MNDIFHSKPDINDTDILAVGESLRSLMIAQGALVQQAETKFSNWFSCNGAVTVASGGAALTLALYGLKVTSGDEVILPTYVCSSVLEAVLSVGATPILCDVGGGWVITSDTVEKCISSRTKAIIAPHMYGVFVDIESLNRFGIPIIEDAAQALPEEKSKSLKSELCVLSFHPTKCITSGEGGMVVSDNVELIERIRSLRDGSSVPQSRFFSPMSNIAASLLLSQAKRYSKMIEKRRIIASEYIETMKTVESDCQYINSLTDSMFFRFPVRIKGGLEKFQFHFLKRGIHIRKGVDKLLHRRLNRPDDDFQTSVKLFNETISIPIYPSLSQQEKTRCINAIRSLL